MFETIPQELKQLNQWVCVRSGSKVPMMATENRAASSSNPQTWSSFDSAVKAVECGYYDNIGFVFNDNGYVGIDIDDGFEDECCVTDLALDVILKCASYHELSRSGRGFHILVKGDLPFNGANNHNGLQIYKTGRYFIMTGLSLGVDPIRQNQTAIDYLVDQYFPTTRTSNSEKCTEKIYKPEWKVPNSRIQLHPTYPTIKNGSRNISLTSLGGCLRNMGYSKSQIYDQLIRCNEIACRPTLDEYQVQQIVNSVYRYAK